MAAVLLRIVACACAGVCAASFACIVGARLSRVGRVAPAAAPGVDELLSDRVLSFAVLAALGGVLSAAVDLRVLPVCLVLAWVLAGRMPAFVERRRAAELRSACDGQLDVLEDIVAMGVRAGLSFDAALDLYCGKFDGELSREVRRARLGWKTGVASRERALADLAARVGSQALAQFGETVTQAVRYGSPLASMLTAHAADLRKARRESIERQVAKAPVKLLVPTATCILPALLILVLGPAIVQFAQSGI